MSAATPSGNRKLIIRLALFSTLMFGVGYALVPLYTVFCNLSGLNLVNVTEAPANTQVDLTRVVNIEFDSNVHDLPWEFRPVQAHLSVHPGELVQIEYEVVNTKNQAITGQAIPSYGPREAGEFFKKLSCFCFSKQTLEAGERRRMPVVFVVERGLPKEIGTITLSYTFFEVEGNKRAEGRAVLTCS
jgi:cytochrome c oxidase assembly protein subunit 11